MKPLLAIVGPTATGKSSLGVSLALELGGEIINADAHQVYRHMDIGTAKPDAAHLAQVPHHLLDIVSPDEPFSLALYQERARSAIDEVFARGRLPFLVGGSGLYVWCMVEGWRIPPVPPDEGLRRRLEQEATLDGGANLHQRLTQIDPTTAARIDPRNVRRVVRALEVALQAGAPSSHLQGKAPPAYPVFMAALTAPRRELYRRIDARVEDMVRAGLVAEVRHLVDMGYGYSLPPMSGIGYREIGLHLQGRLSLEEAVQAIKYATHRLARRQYAWFRPDDPRLHWFDITSEGLLRKVASSLRAAIDTGG